MSGTTGAFLDRRWLAEFWTVSHSAMEWFALVIALFFTSALWLAGAFFAPLPILCLGVLVSVIQAVVFVLLSLLYCAGAMEHAH